MHTLFGIKGKLQLIATDKDGNTFYDNTMDNLLLNSGRAYIIDMLSGTSSSRIFTKIGIGTDNTAAAVTQTGIIAGAVIESGTVSETTTSVANDTLRCQAVFSFNDAPMTIQEACLMNQNAIAFTQPLDGVTRVVVSPSVTMPIGSALTAIWTLQVL